MKPFSGSVSEPGSLRETTWTQLITESQQPDPATKKTRRPAQHNCSLDQFGKDGFRPRLRVFFEKIKKFPGELAMNSSLKSLRGVGLIQGWGKYVLELKGVIGPIGWLVHVQWLRFDGCPDFSRRGMIESAKPMAYDVKCWRPRSNRPGFTCFFLFPCCFWWTW